MQNKVEIDLFLEDSSVNLYWNGGGFSDGVHMFPVEGHLRQFERARDAAISQFGEQKFTLEVVRWNQVPGLKKGERFVYEPL